MLELMSTPQLLLAIATGSSLTLLLMCLAASIVGRWICYALCAEYKGNIVFRIVATLCGCKDISYTYVSLSDGDRRITYLNSEGRRECASSLVALVGTCLFIGTFVVYLAVSLWEVTSILAILWAITKLSRFTVQLRRRVHAHISDKSIHQGD